jgi:hypothetical protein
MARRLKDRAPEDLIAATRVARAQWQETAPGRDDNQTEPAYDLAAIATNLGIEPWEAAALIVGDVNDAGHTIPDKGRPLQTYRRNVLVALALQLTEQGVGRGAIARRLGISPRTVDYYRYDPTNAIHRQLRQQRPGTCEICGEDTSYLRRGRGSRHCARPRGASDPKAWTMEDAAKALRAWEQTFGSPPTLQDLDRARARRRGPEAVARLDRVNVPSPSALRRLWGSGPAALDAVFGSDESS